MVWFGELLLKAASMAWTPAHQYLNQLQALNVSQLEKQRTAPQQDCLSITEFPPPLLAAGGKAL